MSSEFPAMFAVQPLGCAAPSLPARRTLHYRFVEPDPEEVFSARVTGEVPDSLECAVASNCRPLKGDFRAHSLNRIVARELLSQSCSVLWLRGTHGCVIELARIARLMGVAVVLELDDDGSTLLPLSPWLLDCLHSVTLLVHPGSLTDEVAREVSRACSQSESLELLNAGLGESVSYSGQSASFDYSLYEFLQRDQPLLMRMQAPHVGLFEGCRNVLDLGCGAGLFLALLQERGIPATGVERNERIAAYGRAMGLSITTRDALEFLQQAGGYDGIYCSHFVEHLPFEAVANLIRDIAAALTPGGVAVLVFPDPESIRSQLLGFWRDPEHVRFYHPELIETLALTQGLKLEWSTGQTQPHRIVSFSEQPPPVDLPAPGLGRQGAQAAAATSKGWRRWFSGGRQQLESRVVELELTLQAQYRAMEQLLARTEKLWAVNRTWAWQDNAVLKLRKMGGAPGP